MKFRTYLISFFIMVASILLLIGVINVVVDPYGVYHIYSREGFNFVKPEITNHLRLAKAIAVKFIKPHTLILGSSTAETGIDPNHPGWKYPPVYNLGLSGANIYEVKRYYEHARAQSHIREVVLLLDFFMFNESRGNRPDFDEDLLDVTPNGEINKFKSSIFFLTVFSLDALKASFKTLTSQQGKNAFKANGQLEWDYRVEGVMKLGGYTQAFKHAESYYSESYFPSPTYSFSFTNQYTKRSSFDALRSILRMSAEDKAKLTIIISPSHVRLLECFQQFNIWKEFEFWKREIIEIALSGNYKVPVYDFSSCYALIDHPLDKVSPENINAPSYWDGYHFNSAMGNLILAHVLENKPLSICSHVLLYKETLENHLHEQRLSQQRWRSLHPNEFAELKKVCAGPKS